MEPDIDVTRKLRPRKVADAPVVVVQAEAAVVEVDPITGWLVVTQGMGRGRCLPLGYGVHPVGRSEDQRVSVRFGDKKISRRSHVEIAYDGEARAFQVMPGRGGSTPGFHNGQEITGPTPLRAGDRIRLGETELVFVPFCGEGFDWRQEG